jgi:hypothetical protein
MFMALALLAVGSPAAVRAGVGCMRPGGPNGGWYFDNNPNDCPQSPNAPPIVVHYAAIAYSASTHHSGSAHAENSEAAAEQKALNNCAGGAPDCRLLNWVRNQCLALAVSYPDGASGQGYDVDRSRAGEKAIAQCAAHGKNCLVQSSPCADDDPRWPSPRTLPPPPAGARPSVDPRTVGTWMLFLNPGRWIWTISANGTYEFHSESDDPGHPDAGYFSASGGHWSTRSITGNTDGGTYAITAPGVWVATGHLGTGTWRLLPNGDDDP